MFVFFVLLSGDGDVEDEVSGTWARWLCINLILQNKLLHFDNILCFGFLGWPLSHLTVRAVAILKFLLRVQSPNLKVIVQMLEKNYVRLPFRPKVWKPAIYRQFLFRWSYKL